MAPIALASCEDWSRHTVFSRSARRRARMRRTAVLKSVHLTSKLKLALVGANDETSPDVASGSQCASQLEQFWLSCISQRRLQQRRHFMPTSLWAPCQPLDCSSWSRPLQSKHLGPICACQLCVVQFCLGDPCEVNAMQTCFALRLRHCMRLTLSRLRKPSRWPPLRLKECVVITRLNL